MTRYGADATVVVAPFTRQPDGEEVIIGRPEAAIFLALPPDAVEVLDDLAAGTTVGAAQQRYQTRYGELPDVEDFLTLLESKGFVNPHGANPKTANNVKFHVAGFPQPLARLLFSRPVLFAGGLLILTAVVIAARQPHLIPGGSSLYFEKQFTAVALVLLLTSYAMVFLHEMAHLIAARAYGVNSRLGIGHRLWMLVAETDLPGVWALPPKQRYLPLLAGPFVDAVIAAVLLLLLFAGDHGLLVLQPFLQQICRALLFLYLMQLLWQCYFFLRTDLYYVVANWFRCKNLMGDTEGFLRNLAARWIPGVAKVDQSHLPPAERRVVGGYAAVWLLGRAIAWAAFFLMLLPVVVRYFVAVYGAAGRPAHARSPGTAACTPGPTQPPRDTEGQRRPRSAPAPAPPGCPAHRQARPTAQSVPGSR